MTTNIAILAAVDAGKTTLCESLLYLSGAIRSAGRVDHQNTFLDTHALERARGITIFSKMARMKLGDLQVTILDTPGHADFTAECERTLKAADLALLLISASDGVTGHTLELWKLLERYQLPTVLFINKMDMDGADPDRCEADLQAHLHEQCCRPDQFEQIAMCDENALECFLLHDTLDDEMIRKLFKERKLFPCFYGSALRMTGVQELMDGLVKLIDTEDAGENEFGAFCYKISRDEKGNRLTWLRITGGSLRVRSMLAGKRDLPGGQEAELSDDAANQPGEKITQIRLYSGSKYQTADEVHAGEICAVTGPALSFCGQAYGTCEISADNETVPVLSYDLIWPAEIDRTEMFGKLKELSEELPEISPEADENSNAIQVHVMGEVQTQILQSIMQERFGIAIEFGEGRIVYRETIASSAEGVGHFEPLRHYAEVHLYLEAGERGSGIVYASNCPTDDLALHWQRLALSTLAAHRQVGVLTGSALTDVRVTLIAGKAHLKHTMGGDFRQAARRALRQGLMKCESVLLEPYYDFVLDIPAAQIGRALLDIENFSGHADAPQTDGTFAHLTGYAPVSEMRNYQAAVRAYTGGRGALTLKLRGYDICHNPEEVIEQMGYDPSRDLRNPTWSVFCAHGAGYDVPWEEVDYAAHVPLLSDRNAEEEALPDTEALRRAYEQYRSHEASSEELTAIFERTYGPIRRKDLGGSQMNFGGGRHGPMGLHKPRKVVKKDPILLVDGYNIIYAWPVLRSLAEADMHAARMKLAEILSNYQGYCGTDVLVVFDAYRVKGGTEHIEKYHDVYLLYTKEIETADRYIEKAVHRYGSEFDITVATSDLAEQTIIWGQGARRMSAQDLLEEVERTAREVRTEYLNHADVGRNRPFAELFKKQD